MTIDIKKTWFYANYNKPKRIKRIMKKYYKKRGNVGDILIKSEQYHLDVPKEFEDSVNAKFVFYSRQINKLHNISNAFYNGNMDETNKAKIIDEVFGGKTIWRETKPKVVVITTEDPKEGILTKIKNKLFH